MTDTPAWTAGPWHYGDEDESVIGVHYVDVHAGEYCKSGYRSVASVEGPFDGDDFMPLDEESRANAHLISAAPELFEALHDLMSCLGGDEETAACIKAERALAKARGNQ